MNKSQSPFLLITQPFMPLLHPDDSEVLLIPGKRRGAFPPDCLFFPTQFLATTNLEPWLSSRNRDFFQTFLTFKQNSLQWKERLGGAYNSETDPEAKNKGCLCFFSFHSVSYCTSQVSSQEGTTSTFKMPLFAPRILQP